LATENGIIPSLCLFGLNRLGSVVIFYDKLAILYKLRMMNFE